MELISFLKVPWNLCLTALLCALAYAVGKRCGWHAEKTSSRVSHATTRARKAARELCKIVEELSENLRTHRTALVNFQGSVGRDESIELQEVDRTVSRLRRLHSELGLARIRIGEQIEQLLAFTESRIDSLTGVANRRLFEEELKSLLEDFRHTGSGFALVMLDLDDFKHINDKFGHPTGDKVLRDVAQVMIQSARQFDLVARTGGDEYGLLMRDITLTGAGYAAERIRQAIEKMKLGNAEVRMTVSAGVVMSETGDTVESMVARADAILYGSKQEGRNQTYLQEDGMIFTPPALLDESEEPSPLAAINRRNGKNQ